MRRHRFDPVAFVFGLLFLGLGIPLLLSDADLSFFDGTWMFPAFLIFAGVILLASARSSTTSHEDSDSYRLD